MSSITGYNPATVPTLASGTYRHVALSISGTVHTLYLDGSMVAQNLSGGNVFASYTSAIQNLYIGCAGDLSYGLTGSIDDFKIWNRVLPPADISAIYYSQLVPPAPFTDLTTIPGLTFWFDANVASTFDFANQVWTDRSGNGNKLNLTASNTLKIALTTVPSTTKPAIQVPYLTNKWVYKTSASSNILFQPNFTLFYVFYNTTNPGPEANIIFYGQNFNIYLIQFSAGSYQISSNTGGTATTITNLVSNSLNILNMSIDTNNNVRVSINGTTIASYNSNYYSTAATAYQIQGGGSQSSNTSTLYISESAYYGSVLNAYQYQQVEGYLAWKWGIQTSLPTTHPYYSAAPPAVSTTFTPTLISGIKLWLDANQPSSFTLSGNFITQWRDVISNITFTPNVSSTNTYNATGLNSKPIVTFPGTASTPSTSQFLKTTNNIGITASTRYLYYFAVFKYNMDTSQTNASLFALVNRVSTPQTNVAFYLNKNTGTLPGTIIGGGAMTSNSLISGFGGSANNNIMCLMMEWNGTNLNQTLRYNGISSNTITSALFLTHNMADTTFGIGDSTYGNFFNGSMSEILFYTPSSALSQYELQQVEGYLAWKWGLQTSLPVAHPYYSAPPKQ